MPPDAAHAAVAGSADLPHSTPLTIIGEVSAGQGLFLRHPDGPQTPLAPRGFLHDFAG
jgi:hypothetical protein